MSIRLLLMIRSPVLSLLLGLVATAATAAEPPVPVEWQDFRGNLYRSGNIIIAGQPLSEAAMQKLEAEGVSTIVNLRTPAEMQNRESTPIAEEQLAGRLSIDYHQFPTGGPDYPYSPATVSAFNSVVENASGPVFLHCNSARRATHLWVAWLHQHRGLSIDEAIELGRQANFGGVPLEGFLARPLTISTPSTPD